MPISNSTNLLGNIIHYSTKQLKNIWSIILVVKKLSIDNATGHEINKNQKQFVSNMN